MRLVFFLEELSAKAFLEEFLPRFLPPEVDFLLIPHHGKSDLQKSLPRKLRAWQDKEALFVVLNDKDSNDCHKLKRKLRKICHTARPDVTPLIRIACHELEAWHLGDFDALKTSFPGFDADAERNGAKYRNVDLLANAAEELVKLIPEYQKVSGSRIIGSAISVEANTSHSFQVFAKGLISLVHQVAPSQS